MNINEFSFPIVHELKNQNTNMVIPTPSPIFSKIIGKEEKNIDLVKSIEKYMEQKMGDLSEIKVKLEQEEAPNFEKIKD